MMSLTGVIEKDEEHECSNFKWIIKNTNKLNFTSRWQELDCKSESFITHFNDSKCIWFLHLSKSRTSDDLAVTLHLQYQENPVFIVEVEMIYQYLKYDMRCVRKKFKAENKSLTIRFPEPFDCRYQSLDKDNDVDDDKAEPGLTIYCNIKFPLDKMKKSKHSKNYDLKIFLRSESLSDVTLVVGETKFFVHKAILASRSPVFHAMFDHQMEENMKNEVMITDIDEEAMKVLILYIYTDEVENLKDMSVNIVIAADKYELKELVNICGVFLSNRIDLENVTEFLFLADLCNVENLKKNCLTFISANLNKVLDAPTFDRFRMENPELVYEILSAFAKRLLFQDKNKPLVVKKRNVRLSDYEDDYMNEYRENYDYDDDYDS